MTNFRFLLPCGEALDLEFRTREQAAAHAAYLRARFFAL